MRAEFQRKRVSGPLCGALLARRRSDAVPAISRGYPEEHPGGQLGRKLADKVPASAGVGGAPPEGDQTERAPPWLIRDLRAASLAEVHDARDVAVRRVVRKVCRLNIGRASTERTKKNIVWDNEADGKGRTRDLVPGHPGQVQTSRAG